MDFYPEGTKRFYLDPITGEVLEGIHSSGEYEYYFKLDGNVLKGLRTVNGTTYYFHEKSGTIQYGYVIINGKDIILINPPEKWLKDKKTLMEINFISFLKEVQRKIEPNWRTP